MRLYLAGPMRGYPGLNYHRFDLVKRRLESQGHTVVSPADLSRAMGYYPSDETENLPADQVGSCLMVDLEAIRNVDGIALMEGWEDSHGATVELALAQFLGKPVFNEQGCLLVVKSKPWRYTVDNAVKEAAHVEANGTLAIDKEFYDVHDNLFCQTDRYDRPQ